jgi:two-component system, LytTR family, response regulator
VKLRSLIVDDEASARSRMARLLTNHPQIEVIGQATNGLEALQSIDESQPDLVFLDIQIPGLDGFQVLRSLPKTKSAPLVVFVTGFDQHALQAFEAQALAYLLKPVDPEKLAAVVDRAVRICAYTELREKETERVSEAAAANAGVVFHQIVGRRRDRIVLLTPKDIVYFAVEDSIVKARTATELFTVNHSMADLEAGLESHNFFRARRSRLVNLNAVGEIRPYFKSSFLLKMVDEPSSEIQVSERQAALLRKRIPGL